MIPTYLLLAGAVLLLWLPGDARAAGVRRYLWMVAFMGSLISGVITGVLSPWGVLSALGFGASVFLFTKVESRGLGVLMGLLVAGLSLGFLLHVLPGFHNPRVIDAVTFTPGALPFSLYLNYDKTLIGLFILGFAINGFHDRPRGERC